MGKTFIGANFSTYPVQEERCNCVAKFGYCYVVCHLLSVVCLKHDCIMTKRLKLGLLEFNRKRSTMSKTFKMIILNDEILTGFP